MAQQVAKIKLTKLVAKNHLTALEKNQLTLTRWGQTTELGDKRRVHKSTYIE